jgi:hypothetical protein
VKTPLGYLLVLFGALLPRESLAQSVNVGLSGAGLVSVQPSDDSYVGGPYLSEGLGGLAPGFGAGFNVIAGGGFVVAAELTAARFELQQSGRLVGGPGINEGAPHTSRLHDTLLSGFIGYATPPGATRTLFLAGMGTLLDSPTVDGVDRESTSSAVVLSGGVEVWRALGARTSLVVSGRYSFVERDLNLTYLGIGPHLLRFGVGLRVRIN